MISGKMTTKKGKAEREQALEDMRAARRNTFCYLLTGEGRIGRTTVGASVPHHPQKDYAVVTQSIGRIARTFEGKSDPIAYDFVDDIAYLVKSYKKRCTTYRKNGCYFVKEGGTSPCD